MAASLTATNTFGSLAAGNQNLSLFDQNFTQLYTGLNTLNTFGNYYADGGSANAYTITVPTTQTFTASTGVPIQFKAGNANTGASTLAVTNGTTVTTGSIITQSAAALPRGTIAANAIVSVIFNGADFVLQSASAVIAGQLTASLGTNVAVGTSFVDGPSVAQGTSGTWFASGSITVNDTVASAAFNAHLNDGTTTIDSCTINTVNTGFAVIALSGFITNPAGNIRITVKNNGSATGVMYANQTTLAKDSTVSAFRIA